MLKCRSSGIPAAETNLQAIIDAVDSGVITNTKIARCDQ